MYRDSRQTIAYTIHCAYQTWRCCCHLFKAAVKRMTLTAIKYNVGGKLRTSDDTCNVPKSSPKVLSFMKNVWQECTLGMFANLGHHEAWYWPLFLLLGRTRKLVENSVKSTFSPTKRLGILTKGDL